MSDRAARVCGRETNKRLQKGISTHGGTWLLKKEDNVQAYLKSSKKLKFLFKDLENKDNLLYNDSFFLLGALQKGPLPKDEGVSLITEDNRLWCKTWSRARINVLTCTIILSFL